MKKRINSIIMVFVVALSAGVFTACELLQVVVAVAELAAPIADMVSTANTNKAAAAAGRRPTLHEKLEGRNSYSPFDNDVEDRLTRRVSTLMGGETLDVTQYMFHEDSFAVLEDGELGYCRTIIDITNTQSGMFGGGDLYEFDLNIAYEADNQRYQADATAASGGKGRVQNVKNDIGQYAARKQGITASIKNIKMEFLKTRVGNTKLPFQFSNVFVQDTEPCYYQFDVEVEYQKTKPFLGKVKATDFERFSKVYRSDFTSLAAATIAVQMSIWQDARANGFKNTPVPKVNFVRVAKFTR